MADSPDTAAPRRGFSSRWILDGDRRTPTASTGVDGAGARPVDTDGDGIADTLSVRVDAVPRRSAMQAIGTWIGRSLATIVFVAALVAAAVAATAAFNAREQLDEAGIELATTKAQLADVRGEVDSLRDDVIEAREASSTASVDVARLEAEREELQLEVRVLRRMLLDSERRAADG